jgi:hypothetical protein
MTSWMVRPSVKRKRTAVDPVIAMFSEATTSKPSGATAARQPLHRDGGGGDVHHRLVLDQARLGQRRDVDDALGEARRQVLRAGRRSWRLPLRRHAGAAGLRNVDDGRGVERGKLSGTVADEIVDELRRARL